MRFLPHVRKVAASVEAAFSRKVPLAAVPISAGVVVYGFFSRGTADSAPAKPTSTPSGSVETKPISSTRVTTADRESAKAKKSDRLLVRLVKKIALEEGLVFKAESDDWVITLTDPRSGLTRHIWGYNFGLNSDVANLICVDKACTSAALTAAGVDNIEHTFFKNPSLEGWVGPEGTFDQLFKYAERYGYNIVLKPKDGTGGNDVYHCTNRREVEAAALLLFGKSYGLAASPYKEIKSEYRIVLLDGVPQLVFEKVRPSVVGDGTSTLRQLFIEFLLHSLSSSAKSTKTGDLVKMIELPKDFDLDSVSKKGQHTPILWKHNLGGGAHAGFDIPEDIKRALIPMAKKAAETVGVRFTSVDIVRVEDDKLLVLEINSGVMMEKAPTFMPEGERVATEIYRAAIKKMFGPALMSAPDIESTTASLSAAYRR